MKEIILDGSRLTEKETAHAYLKEALELPTYYGENLDALMDCLTDLEGVSIIIENPDLNAAYMKKLMKVFLRAQAEGCINIHL